MSSPAPTIDRRFWLTHAVAPAFGFAAVILPLEVTELDLRATDPFFDFATGRWPHIDSWWARGLLHDQGKWAIILLGVACAVALVMSLRSARVARWRRTWAYLAASLALCPAITGILKATTGRHCPWEISRYGGRVEWTPLFVAPRVLSPDAPIGRCWPAAHASSAMALCALYFIARALGRRTAWPWLLPGILVGGAFAFAQHARGAHFLSHSAWSALLCWYLTLGLYVAMRGRLGPS